MTALAENSIFDPHLRAEFLKKHGWEIIGSVGQDTSIRRYFRCERNGRSAILMESVPDHSPLMTRGHKMADFMRLSKWLNDLGLNAPDIYEADTENGYMLLQDFGQISFKKALEQGEDAPKLYTLASDILKTLQAAVPPDSLPDYYSSHVHANHRYVMDYYFKRPDLVEDYHNAWNRIEAQCPTAPQRFLHIDFHTENLMYLPAENGFKQCGILDFQGAMVGPAPYDLGNLLEDARRDVEQEIREQILASYDDLFRARYRILTTQFHCRVIGQFIKIAQESGNRAYLAHIPRLERYMEQALNDSLLYPLKKFFHENGLDFSG